MDFDVNYIKQCVAPGVEPAAIEAIINETSGYNELAVKVVSKDGRKAVVVRQPSTVAAMTETVSSSMKTGADVRFGLGLIPARLLPELKVSVAQATEPPGPESVRSWATDGRFGAQRLLSARHASDSARSTVRVSH